MPFAGVACRIALLLECISQREFIVRHAAAVPGRHHRMGGFVVWPWWITSHHMSLLSSRRMHTTHDGTPRRCTGRCRGVGLPEHHASLCKCVNVWRLRRRRFINVVTLDILPAEIVGQDQDDIRLGGTSVRMRCFHASQRK